MPINPAIIYGAGQAVNQIGQFLGASSAAKRRQKQIDDEIRRRRATLGTKFIDVNRIQGAADRARIEEAQGAGRFEKALDIDTGQFVGGALEKAIPERARTRANLITQDELGRTTRDFQTEQDISQLQGLDVGKPSTGNLLAGLASTGINTFANIEATKQAEEQATQLQTDRENLIPRVGERPGQFAGDLSGRERGRPQQQTQQQDLRASVDQSLAQPVQPQFKNFDDLLMFEVGRGTMTLEQALAMKKGKSGTTKALPDFASQIDKSFGKKLSAFEKNQAKFLEETQFADPRPATPFTKPSFEQDFALKSPFIEQTLGAGSADSVRNILADKYPLQQQGGNVFPLSQAGQFSNQLQSVIGQQGQNFGLGEPPPNDGSYNDEEYQLFLNEWYSKQRVQ